MAKKYFEEFEFGKSPHIDARTRLLNEKGLETFVESSFDEMILEFKGKLPAHYSVIMFDIDYFKSVNDLFSYEQGNLVLKEVGEILAVYRDSQQDFVGILARYGGEEFVIALPYKPLENAVYIADQIREIIESHKFESEADHEKTLKYKITVSLGVSCKDISELTANLGSNEKEKTKIKKGFLRNIIKEANCALEYAKFMGKNNVMAFSNFLVGELVNLNLVRIFYFQNAFKQELDLFNDSYSISCPKIWHRIGEDFIFIRKRLHPRETRFIARLADGLYKIITNQNMEKTKKQLLSFIKKYTR